MFGLGGGAVWGLDIGDYALKCVKMARQGSGLVVQDFIHTRYTDLVPEGQTAQRKEELIFQALMRFFQPQDRQNAPFLASIPSQNVFSRFVGLPPVDRRRVPEIVRFEARQQIPFDLSEVIWDYQLVRPDFMPGEEIEIGLFAVKREVIASFLGQFVMAQDQLEAVQIAPLALYNFVRRDGQSAKPTVVIDIGAQSTDLLIVEDTKFWLRNLPIAGNSFNAILAKKFNISPEEAEDVKQNMRQSEHRRKLYEALQPVLKDLVAEIQRSIGYYKSLARDVKFEEVLLMGEGFRLYGLQRFLSDQLQYRVRPLGELREIAYGAGDDREEEFRQRLPSLAVAMGLAVQGLRQGEASVDLLPEEFTLRRELKKKRPAAVAVVLLVWAAVALMFLGQRMAIGRVERIEIERAAVTPEGKRVLQVVDRKHIDRVIAEAKKLSQEFRGAASKVSSKQGTLANFKNLGQLRDYWAQAISGLIDAIPQDKPIILGDIKLVSGARGLAGSGGMQDDDRGRGRTGGTVAAGEKAFQFEAVTDLRYKEDHLKDALKKALENATVYPEGVKLFKRVLVEKITFRAGAASGSDRGYSTGGRRGADGGGGEEPVGVTSSKQESGPQSQQLVATVTAFLKSPKEVAAEVEKARAAAAVKAASAGQQAPH